jgi:hypothetical protein
MFDALTSPQPSPIVDPIHVVVSSSAGSSGYSEVLVSAAAALLVAAIGAFATFYVSRRQNDTAVSNSKEAAEAAEKSANIASDAQARVARMQSNSEELLSYATRNAEEKRKRYGRWIEVFSEYVQEFPEVSKVVGDNVDKVESTLPKDIFSVASGEVAQRFARMQVSIWSLGLHKRVKGEEMKRTEREDLAFLRLRVDVLVAMCKDIIGPSATDTPLSAWGALNGKSLVGNPELVEVMAMSDAEIDDILHVIPQFSADSFSD